MTAGIGHLNTSPDWFLSCQNTYTYREEPAANKGLLPRRQFWEAEVGLCSFIQLAEMYSAYT